jgi:hypothetical protein
MGLKSGTISLTRYKVLGGRSPLTIAQLDKLLAPRKAGAVRLEGVDVEESWGWVRPLNDETDGESGGSSNTDESWGAENCQMGPWIMLRLRIEKRRVPASLFQLLLKQKLASLAQKRGKPVGRKERLELKEDLKNELARRTLPSVSWLDAAWLESAGDLNLFTTSEKARLAFETEFNKTFAEPLDLRLVRVAPPLLGLQLDADELAATSARLALAVPASFGETASEAN